MSAPAQTQPPGAGGAPCPTLTVFDAVAMIVGIVVGVGIFKAPSIVAGNVGSETAFIAIWIAGGIISLIGALCYAELASSHPTAGGEYHFLNRAYGDWLGFLFAWARMTVIQTGAIAAIAFVFGDYATRLVPLGAYSSGIYAGLAVAAITALNVTGTTRSKWVQNTLTVALALAILAAVAGGLTASPAPAAASAPTQPGVPFFGGLALIFVLLTYGGWNEAAYLSAEIREAKRNIVRALIIGIVVITTLYLLLNLAYLNALGLGGMKASKAVAADLMRVAWGDAGAWLLSIVVVSASLSTLNATVFTGARTNYALGRDFHIFRALGRWDEKSAAPGNALLVQGAIALALVALASLTPDGFTTMVAYTAPAFWLFFMLTGISLFLLRRQRNDQSRTGAIVQLQKGQDGVYSAHEQVSFQVPLYPVTPLLFVAACAYMLYSSFNYAMSLDPGSIGAIVGMAMLATGVPVLMWARRAARAG